MLLEKDDAKGLNSDCGLEIESWLGLTVLFYQYIFKLLYIILQSLGS